MKLGIVTPTYAARARFRACAASLAASVAQLPPGCGVSVVHYVQESDRSPDSCEEIAREYGASFLRARDTSLYDAIAQGFERAIADGCTHLAWLNADEQYLPETFTRVFKAFQNPARDVISGSLLLLDRQNTIRALRRMLPVRRFYLRHSANYILSCATFFCAGVWKHSAKFDLSYRFLADKKWYLSLLDSGLRFYSLKEPLAAFSITGKNASLEPDALAEQARLRREDHAFKSSSVRNLVRALRACEKLLRGCYFPARVSATLRYPDGGPDVQRRIVSPFWKWENTASKISPPAERRIYPPLKRRIAFFCIGVLAFVLRVISAPRRLLFPARNSVLLFEPFGMGDALLLKPLADAFRAGGTSVTLATKEAWKTLFPEEENFSFLPVSPAYANHDPACKYQHPLRDLFRTARRLAPAARGATAIDPRGDVRALCVLYLAGARKVLTHTRYISANDCRVFPFAAHRRPVSYTLPRRVLSLNAFAPQPCDPLRFPVRLPCSPSPAISARRIGVIPCTTWRGKCWPDAHYLALLPRLRERGFSPVFLCAQKDLPNLPAVPGIPVEIILSPSDWISALSACEIILSVNTGPMHLADALGKKLIVLDGPSRLPLWAPENPNARVLEHQRECSRVPVAPLDDGRRTQHFCMALTTPDEVLQSLSSF